MVTAPAALRGVFISYALVSYDLDLFKALKAHLAGLGSEVKIWHSGEVGAGKEVNPEAAAWLAQARVIVLLVSADYLASEACCDEAKAALARHDAGQAHVIPVIARACMWDMRSWGRLPPLPASGKSVAGSPNPDEVWAEVVKGIAAAMGLCRSVPATGAAIPLRAPAAAGSVPHQLREPHASFIGRTKELAELRSNLGRGGAIIASVTGQGGAGKTELARMLAQELRDRYRDGQIEIDLRGASTEPLSPAQVMAKVIHAFDPNKRIPDDETCARLYRDALYGKQALLLLDNARDRAQVEPLQPPQGCLLIVTSRLHFTLPGLYAKHLGMLHPSEAVDLIHNIVPSLDEDTAAELAKLCGYLPLALRVAASTLCERVDLKPARHIERLQSAQERLDEVDAAFATSLDLLSPPERQFWLRLSLFPGDFDAAAGAATGDATTDAAEELLSSLLRWSLLEYDKATERYRLHDLARDYGRSHLDEREQDAGKYRHADHYLKVADGANFAVLDREWGNISAAQGWASAHHMDKEDGAAKLCSSFALAVPFSYLDDPAAWGERGLAAARRLGWRQQEGSHLHNLGVFHDQKGDVREAIQHWEQARAIFHEIGDRKGEFEALRYLGYSHAKLNEHQEVIEIYKDACTIFQEKDDRLCEEAARSCLSSASGVLGNLGDDCAKAGEHYTAIALYMQRLVVVRLLGDLPSEIQVLDDINDNFPRLNNADQRIELYRQAPNIVPDLPEPVRGRALLEEMNRAYSLLNDLGDKRKVINELIKGYYHLREYDKVISYYKDAHNIFRETSDPKGHEAFLYLGHAYDLMGNQGGVSDCYSFRFVMYRRAGDRRGETEMLGSLREIYTALNARPMPGKNLVVVALAERCLVLARAVGDRQLEMEMLCDLSDVREKQGEDRVVVALAEQCLTIARDLRDRPIELKMLLYLSHARARLGENRAVIAVAGQCLTIARELANRRLEMETLHDLSHAHARLGEAHAIIPLAEQCLAIARELGDRRLEMETLHDLSHAHAKLGEAHAVIPLAEQCLTIARELGDRRLQIEVLDKLYDAYMKLGETRIAIKCRAQMLSILPLLGDYKGLSTVLDQPREADEKADDSSNETVDLKEERVGLAKRIDAMDCDVHYNIETYLGYIFRARELRYRRGEANARHKLGLGYAGYNEPSTAIYYYKQALAIFHEISDYEGEVRVLCDLGDALRRRDGTGRRDGTDKAIGFYRQLSLSYENNNDLWSSIMVMLVCIEFKRPYNLDASEDKAHVEELLTRLAGE